ncbi:hypothetical protein VTJ04DRAFT_6666 [Mycothermus thermophilus]|uniref:uncharacterized protein n=1 Tax=Humicola insolens TaxID=85995 RepID=UPI00374475FC
MTPDDTSEDFNEGQTELGLSFFIHRITYPTNTGISTSTIVTQHSMSSSGTLSPPLASPRKYNPAPFVRPIANPIPSQCRQPSLSLGREMPQGNQPKNILEVIVERGPSRGENMSRRQ